MLWTRPAHLLWLLLALAACEANVGETDPLPGDTWEPPRWHFDNVAHGQGAHVFSDIWGADDGGLYVVGQFGFIMTNRGPNGAPTDTWSQMASPTQAHLTAITGLRDGALFGLDANYGELFAVGWEGTLLHYNPNPDGDPATYDGRWALVAGPEGAAFSARAPVDPACPDYDGDGIPDDGDGSGYAGDAPCSGGNATGCDDNCRRTANGTVRPIADTTAGCPSVNNPLCGCIDTADAVSPTNVPQEDADGDGVGRACDREDDVAGTAIRFEEPLFGVTATRTSQQVSITAVGGHGALVTYVGNSAAISAATITNPAAWVARMDLTYRNVDDCPAGSDPRTCANVPVSCPAQCNPRKSASLFGYGGANDCTCPVDANQCCNDSNGTLWTGAGWTYTDSAGNAQSYPAATNACTTADPTPGECLTLCPGCFRRRERTLRAVAASGGALVSVGARGGILFGDPADPDAAWTKSDCASKPLDDRPLVTAVGAANGRFIVVGAAGLIAFVDPASSGCSEAVVNEGIVGGQQIETRRGAPEVFLSDIFPTSPTHGFAVGDRGTLLEVGPNGADALDPGVSENLYGIWRNVKTIAPADPADPPITHTQLWIVGASGAFVYAEYY